MIDSCPPFSKFCPINVSCHLLIPYYFPFHIFSCFGISVMLICWNYLLYYHNVHGSVALLWYNDMLVQKTHHVIMHWMDKMYKFVKHKVPFTHQDTCERAIHEGIWQPEYSCILSAILDDDTCRQFLSSSLKLSTLNQTLIFHLSTSPITSSGPYLFLILWSCPSLARPESRFRPKIQLNDVWH